MEDLVKHTLKRQLRKLATERPYQLLATSAAALVLATGAGALVARTDDNLGDAPTATAVAELRDDSAASRSLARVATAPSSAAPSSADPSSAPSSAAPGSAAPSSAAASPSARAATADPDVASKKAAPKPPAEKVLSYDYQAQINGYYCGPAAVRNALSAAGIERGQETLAAQMGTTFAGTNSAYDTTRALNAAVKGEPYKTTMIPGGAATPAQMDQLQADVVAAISDGRGVVVNVAGSVVDTAGGWHSFPGGHYVAVVGYEDEGRMVKIADSADASYYSYWLSTIDLANWAATRGYSS
ncbi:C39 family peptidase [Micromonospora fiedleri]|uniref:C39 family peptidase n=1 Tax=Micromonospora fiedleri TaxID=1157498 RepID=A0ABS1UV55_9ACTN|nr:MULTISPECIES: C39 family peptidase [Micromonospora]MBL6279533.1 C39 family peptidase [Micromonospora fiedleri]WSK44834.1 C39 family peptidase [Micromonospora maris]